MAGNVIGGKKAAATNRAKRGADYYQRIGALGGAAGRTGGFHANRELARKAGSAGGKLSRKGYTLIKVVGNKIQYRHNETDKIVEFDRKD